MIIKKILKLTSKVKDKPLKDKSSAMYRMKAQSTAVGREKVKSLKIIGKKQRKINKLSPLKIEIWRKFS